MGGGPPHHHPHGHGVGSKKASLSHSVNLGGAHAGAISQADLANALLGVQMARGESVSGSAHSNVGMKQDQEFQHKSNFVAVLRVAIPRT